jgi:hypothetical protein
MSAARDDNKYLAKILKIAERKFGAGNKAVLLMALHQCLLLRRPPPEWLRGALVDAIESAARFEIRTWDEAFGPAQKGKWLVIRKRHADRRGDILLRVHKLGRGVGEKMFAKIGKEIGESSATVSRLYYSFGDKKLRGLIFRILSRKASQKNRKF